METLYPILETLRDFVAKADQLGIGYMVTGSFAMSAYGAIRYTRDIDIIVQLELQKAAAFANAFADEYYVSDISIRRAIDRRSMFNIVNLETGEKIDCIIYKDTEFARASYARRFKAHVAGIDFWTTTKEDLVVAKLNWARESHSETQIRDIANLTADEYDSSYVTSWIKALGLEPVWDEVERWKILHEKSEN